MKSKELDVVLINPGDKRQDYQCLGDNYAAVEPPFLAAVIGAFLKQQGFKVMIIDANAENISPEDVSEKVNQLGSILSVVVVYGSQPSASTQNMTIAGEICKALKINTTSKIAIGGLHPSALPRRTLQEESVDFVIEGEGPYTIASLINVLKSGKSDYSIVPGLWYYKNNSISSNPRAPLIEEVDKVLPIAAWDLLPMHKYRAHNWHCFDDIESRTPYAAIYTSLGCPYSCTFCCINTPFGKPRIRYRDPKLVVEEIDLLVNKYKVKNIKIIDELFILNEKHYMAIADLLIRRDYGLNIWAYTRLDTLQKKNLKKMKKAGINWLAVGIESASQNVRDAVSKRIKIKDVRNVVKSIQDAGIRVIGNFIFGLPEDNLETMQETFNLAVELNCEFVNFYSAMAYPGSKLYDIAIKQKWKMPDQWQAFSQHSYKTVPLPTKYLSAKDVLEFRDNAFHKFFKNLDYLNMIEKKFGKRVKQHVQEMAKTRLKRRLLEG